MDIHTVELTKKNISIFQIGTNNCEKLTKKTYK